MNMKCCQDGIDGCTLADKTTQVKNRLYLQESKINTTFENKRYCKTYLFFCCKNVGHCIKLWGKSHFSIESFAGRQVE